jgi:hypothetical protein
METQFKENQILNLKTQIPIKFIRDIGDGTAYCSWTDGGKVEHGFIPLSLLYSVSTNSLPSFVRHAPQ